MAWLIHDSGSQNNAGLPMTRRELHGWLIVAVLILVMIGVWGALAAAVSAFAVPLVREFGWSRARVSSLASLVEIGFCVGCPVAGWMIDRIGVRIPMVAGALLAGGGMFAASRSHSFATIAGAYLAGGLGRGLVTTVPAAVVVGHWFKRNRGVAMGMAMVGASVGGMIMVVVAARVTAALGWRAAYLALTVPILVMVIPLIILVVRLGPAEEVAPVRDNVTQFSEALEGLTLTDSLRTRSFWLLGTTGVLWFFGIVAIMTQVMIYLIGIGYRHEIAALALSIMFGSTAAGKPVFGFLADWVGPRSAQVFAFVMMAIGCVLLLYSQHPGVLAIFLLIYGLAWGSPLALLPLNTIESLGLKHYGSIGGTLSALNVAGSASGPFVIGVLFDVTGSYAAGFKLCLTVFVFAAFLTLGCKREVQDTMASGAIVAAAAQA
jgi:MFS family permease